MQFLSLRRIIKSGKSTKVGRFQIIETPEQIAPFSFFNFIVYNPEQFDPSELGHVINHEKAHSKQFHSIDNILAQMACIVLWFNPFTWLYKKSLQQNLEFIADQQAQYVSPCERSYQTVLLKASVSNHDLVFTNNFYTSLIKKRIVMLHKSKSRSSKQLKLLIVLPLLGLFIMSFNTKDIYIEAPSEKTNLMENLIKESEVVEIIFTKNTSDADLATIKSDLEKKGFAFEYSGVKRNKDGEITAISVEFSNGKSSSKHNRNICGVSENRQSGHYQKNNY